ncbi:hypothetical protein FS837_005366 [Tulasnella sp. UAMH 9824]|nr:hypothetical protein FS837_005366 [Tulasnella sp. UAMH 9824]
MARYARAVKLEQFDRNVIFSVLLSKRKCRVFHWDAAGCHTTEIDVHDDPTAFIQVIGRFASMSPATMGYDVRFSNARRVLAGEKSRTVLKVFPGPVEQFFDEFPAGADAGNVIKLDLVVDNPIFEARGLLFSRFTRVWEGRERQNWADAERITEAFLCDQTKDIPSVAKVLGSQVIDGTASHHKGITPDDVLGVYQMAKSATQPNTSDSGSEKYGWRNKGRSISKVKSCKELLRATRDWIEGQDPGSRAFINDLGLAYFTPGDSNAVSDSRHGKERDARDHHHLTGTLPFISHQILGASIGGQPISHNLYHDLESIFWVLTHLVLREETSTMAKSHLDALLSPRVDDVYSRKKTLLFDDFEEIRFSGRFKDLASFQNEFAQAWWNHHKRRHNLEPKDVLDMIDSALESLPHSSGEFSAVVRSSEDHSEAKKKRDDDLNKADLFEPAPTTHEGDAQQPAELEVRGGTNYQIKSTSDRELRRQVI